MKGYRTCRTCGLNKHVLHYNQSIDRTCNTCKGVNEMDYGGGDLISLEGIYYNIPELPNPEFRIEVIEGIKYKIIQSKV